MNFVESTDKLLTLGLSAEEFLQRLGDELVLYNGETAYEQIKPPRISPNPERERGISKIYFDFVRFFVQWSIAVEDWRDLQPLTVDFIREYLASPEVDPRKMPGHHALEKKCGQRIQELAMSGRYPEDEVRFQWFGGGELILNNRTWILISILSFLPACASLTAGGEKVTLTENRADVLKCRAVGKVVAKPPYALASDWKKKLRNASAELGGNAVFTEGAGLKSDVEGEAYVCP